jgi:SAM-dependent methyltransferase
MVAAADTSKLMASSEHSGWKSSIKESGNWVWRGEKLWHREAEGLGTEVPRGNRLQYWFVKQIYADQNRSRAVRLALEDLLAALGQSAIGLNIGAGATRYPKVVNLEIGDAPTVDIVGYGTELPFRNDSVDLVIMQEVLEHVDEFHHLLSEVHRILKPGGVCFCQVPFQIGFHPGPADYWRFSKQGIEHLFSPPLWQRVRTEISLGHGSGFYRIAVEFLAVTASCLWNRLYRPTKLLAALLLYPFKWFDLITGRSAERDRIPGGYFCIARKETEIR